MRKTVIAVGAALALVAGGAFATGCPGEMKKIDAALAKKPQLSQKDMDDVQKLRAEGEKLHKEGKHAPSLEALGKAMKLLKI